MIQTVFETSVNIVESLWIAYFLCSYLGYRAEGRLRRILSFFVIVLTEFITIELINHITFFEGLANYITLVIRLGYVFLLLGGNPMLKVWISAITQIILILTSLSGNLFVCFVIGYSPIEMITVFSWQRIVGVCFVQAVHFVVSYFVLRVKKANPIKTKVWYCLILVPLLSALVSLNIFPIVFSNPEYFNVVFITVMSLIPLNVLVYYFYMVISREYDNKLKIELLELQNRNAEAQIEQSKAFVEQMRMARHDMRNHLSVISAYIEGKKTDDATEYIHEILSKQIPLIKEYISFDNSAIEAVINSKIALCNQGKIFTQIHISPDVKLSMSDAETVAVLGNVLDNAIESALKSSDARIRISMTQKDRYTSVFVCNSIDKSVLENNPDLETTNADKEKHGIGLKSVKSIVNKYNGMIEFYEEDGEFCCHILV